MNSACESLIYRTYQEFWQRGEDYADKGKVKLKKFDEKQVHAIVQGTSKYKVHLGFRGNGLSRSCNCPYLETRSSQTICKHIIATVIVWDEARGLARPDKNAIEQETIPPAIISRTDIDSLYNDPVNADLEILRIAADEVGTWSRPHARLPNMPKFSLNKKEPLDLGEVKKAFKEIETWERRKNYDYYFCAGEMAAAFCEILRLIKKRLTSSNPLIVADILRTTQKFHYKLVMELIDDSEGQWQITEAHLDDIYDELKQTKVDVQDKNIFEQKLKEFEKHKDDY